MLLNIIHLRYRFDRYFLLKQELENQQILDYKIWDGIVFDTNAAIGISRTHKQIVNYARKKEWNEVLIAEDDLHFTAPGAFSYFLQQKPKQYDLYLGGISYGRLDNDRTVKDFAGLLLYMVSERFYETFLSIPEGNNIDRSLKGKGEYIVCDPQPAIKHAGFSDHLKTYVDYSEFFNARNLFGR